MMMLLKTFVSFDSSHCRFQHVSYSALLPRNPRGGTPLEIEPEPIYAFDQDSGIKAPILYSIEKGNGVSTTTEQNHLRTKPNNSLLAYSMKPSHTPAFSSSVHHL